MYDLLDNVEDNVIHQVNSKIFSFEAGNAGSDILNACLVPSTHPDIAEILNEDERNMEGAQYPSNEMD